MYEDYCLFYSTSTIHKNVNALLSIQMLVRSLSGSGAINIDLYQICDERE